MQHRVGELIGDGDGEVAQLGLVGRHLCRVLHQVGHELVGALRFDALVVVPEAANRTRSRIRCREEVSSMYSKQLQAGVVEREVSSMYSKQ